MAQFDQALREEVWLFEVCCNRAGRDMYRRLKCNLVSFDGDPEMYLQPINSQQWDGDAGQFSHPDNTKGSQEVVRKFEFVSKGQFFNGVHDFM